jgi:4-hydroxythreonine-4-phosphate dehydrogenase
MAAVSNRAVNEAGRLPVLALTMGDPSSIGPEICMAAAAQASIQALALPLIVGDAKTLARVAPPGVKIIAIGAVSEAISSAGTVNVIDLANVDQADFSWGRMCGDYGRAAYEYIVKASALAMKGEVDALVTAPINKEALREGRVPHMDHTEILERLTNSAASLTMFAVGRMRIFFLTRHLPLGRAIEWINAQRLADHLVFADYELARLGLPRRRFAVAGLNPHAGENGLLGDEEATHLRPGIELARTRGVDAHGPIPADSVFYQALNGRWDAVISLYHDQGHIAAKTYDFERTVSVTLGLPYLRTSVDHGTAFDIAGKGTASAVSMIEAVKVATDLLKQRARAAGDHPKQYGQVAAAR